MVVAALVLQILAQPSASGAPAREIAVLVSRRIGVGEVRGQALARKVSDYLKAQGFTGVIEPAQAAKSLAVMGVRDSAECDGKRECVTGLGRVLRAWGVVAIDLADVDGTMAMHFEALLSDRGEQLVVLDFALPSKKAEVDMTAQLVPLAAQLRAALDAAGHEVKPLPDDAPVASNLTPVAPPPAAVEASQPMSRARVGALVTTASTVVAGALVILFVAQAGSAQRQLDGVKVERPNGAVGYNLPEAQARTLGAKVNDNYSAALGVGIGAAALAVVSAVLWAQP